MPVIFYQSNFCPECGNRREAEPGKRRWLQHRYFCPACAAQLGHRWDWLPIAIAISGLALGTLVGRRPAVAPQVAAPLVSPATAGMALSPVAASEAQLKAAPSPLASYFCGARTQKGRPCKHRVATEGQRCFQHQGMAAMKR